MTQPPNRWLLFQYALLAFPVAFAGLPLYIHAPDFYTRHLGLGLGSIGVILLLVRLFDATNHPICDQLCVLCLGCVALLGAGRRRSRAAKKLRILLRDRGTRYRARLSGHLSTWQASRGNPPAGSLESRGIEESPIAASLGD